MKQVGGSGLWEHHKAPGQTIVSPASPLPFALFHFVFNSSQFHCQEASRRHEKLTEIHSSSFYPPKTRTRLPSIPSSRSFRLRKRTFDKLLPEERSTFTFSLFDAPL